MIRNLIRAVLVCRLELRQLAIDVDLVLAAWHRRPVIEVVLDTRRLRWQRRAALRRRLDEVYPF